MDVKNHLLKINMQDLVLLISIFEGYDHLVCIRTLDPSCGKIAIQSDPSCSQLVSEILMSLSQSIEWTYWDDDDDYSEQ